MHFCQRAALFACFITGLVLGCGDDPDLVGPGGTRITDTGPPPTEPPPENADELALLACEAPERCGEAGLQLVEATSYVYRELESRCVLDALARRVPGRYRYETTSSHSSGHATARHLLLVTTDGSVQYVRSETDQRISGQPATYRLDAGQRCTLKPSAYFEECLETEPERYRNAPTPFWSCAFGDGTPADASHLLWFESCVEASPSACDPLGYTSTVAPDAGTGSGAG